ncbi:DUF1345 domain-containing protein [Sphingomonas citricola]|uniref:DUF1345 domain-containing protein n=1 Tax=Sphingomonas citricola TaxID=2862498 RepID=UPI0021560BCC|nr:DUF1345 domain-containing protein [Sphingomonas citricola]
MNDTAGGWAGIKRMLGQRVAPPRFVLFVLVCLAGAALLWPLAGKGRAVMGGFDLGALAFLVSLAPLFRQSSAAGMRRSTRVNDANRALLLAITAGTTFVILVAVHGELKGKNDAFAIALVIVTLALAWLFSNMVYALHYAHLFYGADDGGAGDAGGLDFPGTKEPDYWDFLYFSYTLGMTFQTSDVTLSSARMRRVAIGQCLAAFVFNLGILAFTINTIGGAGG